MRIVCVVIALMWTWVGNAQWEMQESHTTASLRGIHSVGSGVAWASGTDGTVLRTVDGGKVWQKCAIPEGGEKLDFRGVQGFDAKTAIVMSSGKGELSRLYKTVDGCGTWKLLFMNPDKEGFWDAIKINAGRGFLIGDPVGDRFVLYQSSDGKFERWERFGEKSNFLRFPYDAAIGEALFAASNSVMEGEPESDVAFVTGGARGPHFYMGLWNAGAQLGRVGSGYFSADLPLAKGDGAGAFSLCGYGAIISGRRFVVVGGDYTRPDATEGTAAYSADGGQRWKRAKTQPQGYRSAVTHYDKAKAWIAVGPNGTDVSTDDGKNWRALRPRVGEATDADKNWNALSLPFVVGPKGRIGVLRDGALK